MLTEQKSVAPRALAHAEEASVPIGGPPTSYRLEHNSTSDFEPAEAPQPMHQRYVFADPVAFRYAPRPFC